MRKTVVDAALDELSQDFDELRSEPVQSQIPEHWKKWKAGWRVNLNPTQKIANASKAIYKLYHGERGSSKSFCALNDLVEHCYLNPDALALIVVKEVAQATDGGSWQKLMQVVLPIWQKGNMQPRSIFNGKEWELNPKCHERIDDGIGIRFKEGFDAQTHRPLIWIENRFGGWSKVLLVSLPVDRQVIDKVKGKEPSFIFVDEAQTLESDSYFKFLLQQLGRASKVMTRQTIVYACNPDGPSHWLYKRFFVMPLNEETGEWNHNYAHFHIPVSENEHNLPPNYYRDYVLEAVKGDPIEEARMVRGEWIDRPDGEALFGMSFLEGTHMRGDAARNQGLMPVKGHPIILSYDPGAASTSIHFIQIVPTKDKLWKLVLDEINYVEVYKRYSILVPEVIKRMQYWEEKSGSPFRWVHVSDNSAFNQYRAKDGSFDAWDFENLSKEYVEKNKLDPRFIIRMLECPKGPGSIEARVRLLRDYLENDEIRISATCLKTKQMLMHLEEDKRHKYKPKETSPLTHAFDSLTYGFFYYDKGRIHQPLQVDRVESRVYQMGR